TYGESGNGLVQSFLFTMQERLRGTEAETRQKLQIYLDRLSSLAVPAGPWLDIGCGPGKWLAAASKLGPQVIGIDSSLHSVAHCQHQGLSVAEADALEYLTKTPGESLAVITAFHVIEHFSTDYMLAVIQQATRALKPGGLLILETPDPRNLLM